jgi:hypothetical protein
MSATPVRHARVRRALEIVAPALLFGALIHANAWSDVLAEGEVAWARYVARGAVIAFSATYAALVIFVAQQGDEWVRRVFVVPPAALALGVILASVTLDGVWQRPGYVNTGFIMSCAFPVIVVAPIAIMFAGTLRTLRDARRERSLRTEPR